MTRRELCFQKVTLRDVGRMGTGSRGARAEAPKQQMQLQSGPGPWVEKRQQSLLLFKRGLVQLEADSEGQGQGTPTFFA